MCPPSNQGFIEGTQCEKQFSTKGFAAQLTAPVDAAALKAGREIGQGVCFLFYSAPCAIFQILAQSPPVPCSSARPDFYT